MMVNTSDDDNNNNNCMMTSSLSLQYVSHQGSHTGNFMCTIQNPSSHTEEVSGIMKRMWVDL